MSFKECSECSRVSDNRHYNCPPKMSDGRHFTDYRPRCLVNFSFPNDQPMNSYEYRQYLIQNAEKLMRQNTSMAYAMNMCGPCVEPYNVGTMLPEQNIVKCDANTCKTYINDQDGVGTGRQYMTNNKEKYQEEFLKQKQKEQQLLSSANNCCATPADDLAYFPWDGMVLQEDIQRVAVPGGGVMMSGGDRM